MVPAIGAAAAAKPTAAFKSASCDSFIRFSIFCLSVVRLLWASNVWLASIGMNDDDPRVEAER